MKLLTDNLILRTVTIDDLNEVSRMWSRDCYKRVMEVSIYIGEKYKGQGIGAALLMNLIKQSEENSIWTLYSAIIEENIASIALHKKWSNLLGKAAGTATSNKARNSPCNYFFI